MVKTKREYILATAFVSGIAAIVSIAALGTQEWVTSDIKPPNELTTNKAYIEFGLFGGFVQTGFIGQYEVQMYCLYDKNVCGLFCSEDHLKKFYDHTNGLDESTCNEGSSSSFRSPFVFVPYAAGAANDTYINAGLRLTTIIFLVVSFAFGLISTCLSVWNTVSNPYQIYCSIYSLYVYNGIAFVFILLAIVLWSAEFLKDIKTNIPTYVTMASGGTTENLPKMGYSFWILLIPLFFYMISCALLYARQYQIAKEPEVNVQMEDNTDGTMHLY